MTNDGSRVKTAIRDSSFYIRQSSLLLSGLVFLALAGIANYSSDIIEVVPGTVAVHFGSASLSFPAWWVISGVPLLLLSLGMTSGRFRRAAAFPWRNRFTAWAVLLSILLLGFTLVQIGRAHV
jgi:hypothetical protein